MSKENPEIGETSSASDASNQEPESKTRRPPSFHITVLSLCTCVFLATLNSTNFASAVPAVASDLRATTTQAYWCGTVLLFAQCVSQPVYGAFVEVLGGKTCMLAALAIFTLASLLSALAQNVEWLIMARAIQGLGAGGVNVCVNVISVDLVPQRERARLNGIVSLSAAPGLVAGMLSGAVLSAEASWRIIFYLNIPIAVVAFLLLAVFLRIKSDDKSDDKTAVIPRIKSIDWTGIILISGSVTGLIFGLISGGTVYPWSSVHVLAPLILGAVALVAFSLFEEYMAGRYWFATPFIPLRLFSNRTAAAGYSVTFLHDLVLWAMNYYFLLFLHVSGGKSLQESSVIFLPCTLLIPLGAGVGGFLITRLGRFKYFNITGFALIAAGMAGLCTLSSGSSLAELVAYQVPFAIGGGMLFPGRLVAVQASQTESDVRMATSLVSFVNSLGQAFGIAIGSTALQNAWDSLVQLAFEQHRIPSGQVISGQQAVKAAEIIATFPDGTQRVYRDIAADSIARVWYTCAAMAGAGLIAALASRNLRLGDRK